MTTLKKRNKFNTNGIVSILTRERFPAARWHQLGVMLGVPSDILENIGVEKRGQATIQLTAVIDYWLNNDLETNWERLANALEESGHKRIANVICEAENIQRSRSNTSSGAESGDRHVSRDGGDSLANGKDSHIDSGGSKRSGAIIIGLVVFTLVVGGLALLILKEGGVPPGKNHDIPRKINPTVPDKGFPSTPIESELDLERELSEVADWISLCSHLGVSRGVLDSLENSGESVTLKKRKCLNNYYDSGEADWAKVVAVVANPPIDKKKKACEIAAKYINEGLDLKTCLEQLKN